MQPEHGPGLVSVYNVLADFHDEDKFSYSRIGEGSVEKTNPKGRERIRSSFFTKLLEEKQFEPLLPRGVRREALLFGAKCTRDNARKH